MRAVILMGILLLAPSLHAEPSIEAHLKASKNYKTRAEKRLAEINNRLASPTQSWDCQDDFSCH